MRASRSAMLIVVVSCCLVLVTWGTAVAAAKKVPDACALITKSDVATAFAKLDTALQPLSIADPVVGKPASQGGQGTNSCSTTFSLPGSVGGSVLVKTNPVTKQLPCPPKGQPGKTVKIAGTASLLEPNPSDAKVVRDITFVDQGGCAFIEIFLSGGSVKVPGSAFVELATAALAKKASGSGGATPSVSSKAAPAACTLVTKTDAEAALGQAVNGNDAASANSCEYRETSGPNFLNVQVAAGQTAADLQRTLSNSGPLQTLSGLGDAAYLGPVSIAVLKNGVSVHIDWLGGATPDTPTALKQLATTAIGRL